MNTLRVLMAIVLLKTTTQQTFSRPPLSVEAAQKKRQQADQEYQDAVAARNKALADEVCHGELRKLQATVSKKRDFYKQAGVILDLARIDEASEAHSNKRSKQNEQSDNKSINS